MNALETVQATVLGYKLTPGQLRIVGAILDPEIIRLSVCAMTRYGKTRAAAIAVLLYIMQNKNKKILFIGPTINQTNIIRNYTAEHISTNIILANLVDAPSRSSPLSLKKEVSKKRVTFKNGCEMISLTAHGQGEQPGKQLMGFGGDLIIPDEACLISDEVYRSRISRMLGDSPDSKLVELVNPWHRQNFAWRHWRRWQNMPGCKTIHINYQQALLEGRVTETFIQEQKLELSDYEFTVLYKSLFAEDAEDTLIRWNWITRAKTATVIPVNPRKVWGLDVGEQGPDLTVLTEALTDGVRYNILNQQIIRETETMPTANAVSEIVPKEDLLNVDSIGIGAGVYSRLRELGHNAVSIRGSEKPNMQPERFLNLKAQRYWQLRTIFECDNIKILEGHILPRQLSTMKYEFTASGKIKIIDPPNKSPDFCDSLCLCVLRRVRRPKVKY